MPTIKPMLAHKYEPKRFIPNMFIQPKLDGLRALYQDGEFASRDGVLWHSSTLKRHREFLARHIPPGTILDGEFYNHGMPLQQINSRVGVGRKSPHPEETNITFRIFDVFSFDPFASRYLSWIHSLSGAITLTTPLAALVPTYQIQSLFEGDRAFKKMKGLGYEGLMYRHPTDPYASPLTCKNKENRVYSLLKRKSWQDLDAIIVGFNQGMTIDGQPKSCLGSFELMYGSVRFSAGSGLSDLQRDRYWRDPEVLLGCRVKIQYECFSDAGTPLKPIILLVEEPLT